MPEPGTWRVEIMPNKDVKEDNFLVVLLPNVTDKTIPVSIRRLYENGKIGCEIIGPQRTTRW